MGYNNLTDSELLHVAKASDSELVRELVMRFERLRTDYEELFDHHVDLREEHRLNDDDEDWGDYRDTRSHLTFVSRPRLMEQAKSQGSSERNDNERDA